MEQNFAFVQITIDDGKGRTFTSSAEPVPLHEAEEVREKGDYKIIQLFDLFDCLVLACPFCAGVLETRYSQKIESKDPLTLADELTCEKCEKRFHIITGLAIESWI